MRYPHVRVAAAGETEYFETSRDYADAADWTERVATGWVRTAGRQPTRLHVSERQGAPGRRVDAIQRGGCADPVEPGHLHRDQALRFVGNPGALRARRIRRGGRRGGCPCGGGVGNHTGATVLRCAGMTTTAGVCAGVCRFPLMEVGIGEVARIENADELAHQVSQGRVRISELTIGAAQSGADGVIVAVNAEYASGGGEQSVLLVGREADTWRIAGISRMTRSGVTIRQRRLNDVNGSIAEGMGSPARTNWRTSRDSRRRVRWSGNSRRYNASRISWQGLPASRTMPRTR